MSNQHNHPFNVENFFDSEDLMSWLLLNPEMVDFDESALPQLSDNGMTGFVPHQGSAPLDQPGSSSSSSSAPHYINPAGGPQSYSYSYGELPPSHIPMHAAQIPMSSSLSTTDMSGSAMSISSASQQGGQFDNARIKYERGGVSRGGGGGETSGRRKGKINESAARRAAEAAVSAAQQKTSGKKRQRETVEDVEARVKELRSENADLQAHLMNVLQRTAEVQRQRVAMERMMVAKLAELGEREDGTDQEDLAILVKKYTDIYADYGNCRQKEVAFHLHQLEKLLLPTKTTKMSLWALQQDKSFFQKNRSPMFDLISQELGLSTEQVEKVQERKEKVSNLLAQLRESLSLIETLKTAIEKKHSCYDGICGRVQQAATPKQTVQFLMWISKHADELTRYIPAFTRRIHYTPGVQFMEGEGQQQQLQEQQKDLQLNKFTSEIGGIIPQFSQSSSSSSSSSSAAAGIASTAAGTAGTQGQQISQLLPAPNLEYTAASAGPFSMLSADAPGTVFDSVAAPAVNDGGGAGGGSSSSGPGTLLSNASVAAVSVPGVGAAAGLGGVGGYGSLAMGGAHPSSGMGAGSGVSTGLGAAAGADMSCISLYGNAGKRSRSNSKAGTGTGTGGSGAAGTGTGDGCGGGGAPTSSGLQS